MLEVTKEQLQKADASLVKQLAVSTGGEDVEITRLYRILSYIVTILFLLI